MVLELIEAGLREHQAGRLTEAKRLYEQALVSSPRHPDALHLLGVVALQSGDVVHALTLIGQAIELQPRNPGFHANLAHAHLAGHRVADAHAAFREAAALDPLEPRFELGAANCLALQGRHAEAEVQLRALVARHSALAPAWFNLGNVVREQGRHEEALDLYRRAVALEPGFPDARMGLGNALHALERFEEAEREYRQWLRLKPGSTEGYCNLASVLIDVGRFREAVAACEEGSARSQPSAELHFVRGIAHAHQGELPDALRAFRDATNLDPHHGRASCAYGSALHDIGRRDEGLQWLEHALMLEPQSPEFRYILSGACLSAGDLQEGWIHYEYRPSRQPSVARFAGVALARELPEKLSGLRVCLLREQGIGDELFFLRFAKNLKARGAKVSYCGHAKLVSLLERTPLLDRVTGGERDSDAEITMLLCDLPQALARSARTEYPAPPSLQQRQTSPARNPRNSGLPRRVSIFSPELPPTLALPPLAEMMKRTRERLAAAGPAPYLGFTWRAGTAPEAQRGTIWSLHKQVPLKRLGEALRRVNGTCLALQRNPKPEDIPELTASIARPVHDFTDLNEDLEKMLALLALIDEYIGVSNTNMHLRAAAGRTARVLVPLPAEWRWTDTGDESPWFPGFRIYRQRIDGGWEEAFARLARDLLTQYGER